jgi:hypothetical protein
MIAGICISHKSGYLGSTCPACVVQQQLSKVVADLHKTESERDIWRRTVEERAVIVEIDDDVAL